MAEKEEADTNEGKEEVQEVAEEMETEVVVEVPEEAEVGVEAEDNSHQAYKGHRKQPKSKKYYYILPFLFS